MCTCSPSVLQTLSPAGCGLECSVDGIHSMPPVYDTAAQVLLNMFALCQGDPPGCWAEEV